MNLVNDLWQWLKDGFFHMVVDLTSNVLTAMNQVTDDMFHSAFLVEDSKGLWGTPLVYITVSSMLKVAYGFLVLLLALKLCWQGYKVYVLWRDGEAEVSPGNLLVNSVYAMAVAIAFPTLYEIAVGIAEDISESLLNAFYKGAGSGNIWDTTANALQAAIDRGFVQNTALLFALLIFILSLVLISIQMVFRGISMLVYRMGVPFAAVGLVNSDGGVWKNYIQIFFQQLAIVVAQNVLLRMSVTILVVSAPDNFAVYFFAAVLLITSFKMPKILAPILATGGSGQGAYTALMTARMVLGRR